MEKIFWIVGKVTNTETYSWEFAGVFDSHEKAVSACISERYFVGPAVLNKAFPDDPCKWEGAYYPFEITCGTQSV